MDRVRKHYTEWGNSNPEEQIFHILTHKDLLLNIWICGESRQLESNHWRVGGWKKLVQGGS